MNNQVYLKNIIKEVFKSTLNEGFLQDQEAKGTQIRDAIVGGFNAIFKEKYNMDASPFRVTYSKDNLSIQSENSFKNGLVLRATVQIYDTGPDGAPQPTATGIDYKISVGLFAPQGHTLPDNIKDVKVFEQDAGAGRVETLNRDLGNALKALISKTQNVPTNQTPTAAAPAAQKPVAESLRRLLGSSK